MKPGAPLPSVKTECINMVEMWCIIIYHLQRSVFIQGFIHFSLAATHTHTHLRSPFSIWLNHMIALARCPLTSSCLKHPDRSAERIRAQRKARGERRLTSTPAQHLAASHRLYDLLHYTACHILPEHRRTAGSVAVVQSKLKAYLFSLAFDSQWFVFYSIFILCCAIFSLL